MASHTQILASKTHTLVLETQIWTSGILTSETQVLAPKTLIPASETQILPSEIQILVSETNKLGSETQILASVTQLLACSSLNLSLKLLKKGKGLGCLIWGLRGLDTYGLRGLTTGLRGLG